ncbi:MAG TPA: fenitrothion hydrolase [Solirubrobacteraceae bacterium]|nr:fenitrothion hydrolase [Solirubrobacteraceae bacterium]
MTRRLAIGMGAGLLAGLIAPAAASAHGLILVTNLPIPQWLFAWAAAVVLVVSFVALATLWPAPRLARIRERPIWHCPRWLEPLCGALGVAFFVLIVYAGIAGSQITLSNITPTWIYVVFWVGLAFLSILFGDAFRPFNPWRAIARAIAWIAQRVGGENAATEPLHYPDWLGRWPAVLGLLGYAWLELVYVNKDAPNLLAFLSLGYAAAQLVGMSLYGIDTWTERGDAFAVFYDFLGRMAPLHWKREHAPRQGFEVYLRPPFVGALSLEMLPGTIAMVIAMIATTSFDGLSNASVWLNGNGLFYDLQSLFIQLGLAGKGYLTADELAGTVGLLAMVGVIAGFFRVGIVGMRSISTKYSTPQLTRSFAHTLLPIAIAYFVAHYFSLLAFSGQWMIQLVSDPLGNGANIFGTANIQPDYGLLSGNSLWYVQVAALVSGHAAGITLAHDRALTLYPDPREATRSQYWMLTVMVAFTCLGLWILSSTY